MIPFYKFLSLEIYGRELQEADPHKQGAIRHHGPRHPRDYVEARLWLNGMACQIKR